MLFKKFIFKENKITIIETANKRVLELCFSIMECKHRTQILRKQNIKKFNTKNHNFLEILI